MKKYDTYKDSGIEWIGEIPSHWEVNRFKYLFFEHSGNGFPNELQGRSKGEVPFFKVSDLNKEGITVEYSRNYVSFDDVNDNRWNIVPEKSILTAKIGESLKKNHRKISSVQCIIDNNCLGIEPISINGKYAFYQLCIVDFDWFVNPGAIPSISMEKLRNHFFPIPSSPEEQSAIASYLDRKTSEIDELIADKKRLLELYEEEKTAIINQAVTGKWKMKNGKWKMKDSGIEWLGEIPEHWEVKRLSWCFDIIGSGTTPKAGSEEYYFNGEFNWLLTGDLTDGDILETSKKVTQKALDDYSSLKKYPINSIVMAMYGATIGKLGILKITTTVNQACCVLGNPIHLHYQFAFFLLLAARKEIINMSYGGGQPNISQELIKSFRVQVPPLEEQHSIVQYIETETASINQKVAKTEILIELLTEYRQALISEVVTGKVKVTEG